MSTTTDRRSLFFRIVRFVATASGVVAVWFAGLAIVTLIFEPDNNVTVFGPDRARTAAIDATDVKILTAGTGFVTVVGQQPGFVRALYAGGAWLVLPGLGRGCGYVPAAGTS